jgi:high affinity Mn2+ porin
MTPFALGRHTAPWVAIATLFVPAGAGAQEIPPADSSGPNATTPEIWAVHAQATFVDQYHPGFAAAFSGPESLNPGSRGDETFDATLYAGVRPWQGGEIWISPEIDQGFGFDDTLGVAAFTSAEAYKVGAEEPYVRIPRLFYRQTIDIGGSSEKVDPDLFTLGGQQTVNRVVVTVGKFSVPDIFDTNAYAHDPRQDFLNWALVDMGTFDYAADSWGYTYGAATEWYQNWWTLRAGAFTLSRVPNSEALDTSFGQVQFIGEAEERHTIWGEPGKLKLLAFLTRGRMGDYGDATAIAKQTDEPASVALVRRYRSRTGIGFNLEQAITDQVGFFVRAGLNEGGVETYEFTDINKTFSVGLSLQGKAWGRPNDTVGLATAIDDISRRAKNYLAAGGLGVLVGDGALPVSCPERVAEAFYSFAIASYFHMTADYQFVNAPAYNPLRGPVSVLAVRFHFQY